MKVFLIVFLMLWVVGCESESPPMFTEEELQRDFDALDREAEEEETERIRQSPEYKAWLAEYEAMKRRHEAENSRPIQFYSLQSSEQAEIDEQQAENQRLRWQMEDENQRLRLLQEQQEQRIQEAAEAAEERAEELEWRLRELEQAERDAERMRHNNEGLIR